MTVDDEWRRTAWTALVLVGLGIFVGLVYGALAWRLQEAVPVSLRSFVWGPGAIFGLTSLVLGLGAAWLAERVAGFCGEILLIPIAASALVAAALGAGVNAALAAPAARSNLAAMLLGIAVFLAAGACRILVRRLR